MRFVAKRCFVALSLGAVALPIAGCPLQCEVLNTLFGTWYFQNENLMEQIAFNSDGTMVEDLDFIPGAANRLEATWEACWRGSSQRGTLVLMVSFDGDPQGDEGVVDPPERRVWTYNIVDAQTVVITKGRVGYAGLTFSSVAP